MPTNLPLFPQKTSRAKRVLLLCFLLFFVFLLYGFLVGRKLVLTRKLSPLGLPTPVRVAVLGDFHVASGNRGGAAARAAVLLAERQKPDLIVLVGDYVAGRGGLPYMAPILKGIHAPLGVYAVLGNHDHWADAGEAKAQLQAAGIRVLDNEHVVLQKGETRMALAGIDDLWAGKVSWQKALSDRPKDLPLVLVSHNPDAAHFPQGRLAQVIISGHTHGGQIRLPRRLHRLLERLAGFNFPPATGYGRAHPYGLMREPWGWVYVTSGVAPGYAPPRWYTSPEVVVLELK
jgi:predicted MPP superfamily phosphohydrolase